MENRPVHSVYDEDIHHSPHAIGVAVLPRQVLHRRKMRGVGSIHPRKPLQLYSKIQNVSGGVFGKADLLFKAADHLVL